MLICTGIYSLDGVTQIIDKYRFFVVIEGRVGQVTSFHNIICDFVYFKLSVVLWHFIIINFYMPRVKSVNEYSVLYFCVCMAGLFENWWDYTAQPGCLKYKESHTMIVVKTLKNPLCFRMSLCTWLLSRYCLSAVDINCHQLFYFVPNKTIRYQLKYFHRNLDFKNLYKKQGPRKKYSNTSNTARYRSLKSIIHCMYCEFASETFF